MKTLATPETVEPGKDNWAPRLSEIDIWSPRCPHRKPSALTWSIRWVMSYCQGRKAFIALLSTRPSTSTGRCKLMFFLERPFDRCLDSSYRDIGSTLWHPGVMFCRSSPCRACKTLPGSPKELGHPGGSAAWKHLRLPLATRLLGSGLVIRTFKAGLRKVSS